MSKFQVIVGAGGEDVERQLNAQGLTAGDSAALAEKIRFGITLLYIHGIATRTERERLSQRFVKWLANKVHGVESTDPSDQPSP